MPDSLLSIVTERRARYLKQARLVFLSIATLLAFQFLIFDPYIETTRGLSDSQNEKEQVDALLRNLEKREAAYVELQKQLEADVERLLETMMDGIASDLDQLTYQVNGYIRDELRKPLAELGMEESDPSSMAMQMPLSSDVPAASLHIPYSVQVELGEATSWREIRELLQEVVERQVIEVRVSEYNVDLQQAIDDALSRIEKANGWRPSNLGALEPELQQAWNKAEDASERAEESLKSISLTPPSDERWWWSMEGKLGARSLELRSLQEVMETLREALGYESIVATLSSELQTLKETSAELEKRQADLEATFAAFEGTMTQLLGPMSWLPLGIGDVVLLMPFWIACSLGAGVGWLLVKRSSYLNILDTSAKRSEEVAKVDFLLSLDVSAVRLRIYSVAGCLAALGWIVYCNRRLGELEAIRESSSGLHVASTLAYSAVLNGWIAFGLAVAMPLIAFTRTRPGIGD
ncbi:hypothetical protein [Pelagicoccus sp. SDUM812003]|uniref:hypothetical protein n=1 Tax=Pelagicoccus sp. SDUM812003 TaxID=3041267 RepID=UPI0028107B80|nr:hypothetical protein [Pelagicoccus sp. SDUM812003]MDQ8204766.1 hypothetical protein [Pelagicoccus sp. SDUM812003]